MDIVDWQMMKHGFSNKIYDGFILYGASGTGERMVMLLHELGISDKIIAVVDSNEKKWGNTWIGYKISNPEVIKSVSKNTIIIITSVYLNEILEFLQNRIQCCNNVCSAFAFRHALHYDIINGKSDYIESHFVEKYKNKYKLWKDNAIIEHQGRQELYFNKMLYCIAKNPSSILLCAIPKTGNTTLTASFEEEKRIDVSFTYHASYFDSITLKKLKEYLNCFNEHKIKIISAVREPIERIISEKWENIKHTYLNNNRCIPEILDKNYDYFINDLLLQEKMYGMKFNWIKCNYSNTADWYKDHIERAFNINVFNYPFDKDKGYSIIEENNISIFIYRLDKLSGLEKEIKEFSGGNSFKLQKSNLAKEKRYALAYKQYLEKVKIKKGFFDDLICNDGMEHFYTKQEYENYIEKWSSKLV